MSDQYSYVCERCGDTVYCNVEVFDTLCPVCELETRPEMTLEEYDKWGKELEKENDGGKL